MQLPILHSIVLVASGYSMPAFAFAQVDSEVVTAARQYLSDQARSWKENPVVVDAEGLLML